ncbi:hypothetical protein D3C71_1275680 [compost metagenome]
MVAAQHAHGNQHIAAGRRDRERGDRCGKRQRKHQLTWVVAQWRHRQAGADARARTRLGRGSQRGAAQGHGSVAPGHAQVVVLEVGALQVDLLVAQAARCRGCRCRVGAVEHGLGQWLPMFEVLAGLHPECHGLARRQIHVQGHAGHGQLHIARVEQRAAHCLRGGRACRGGRGGRVDLHHTLALALLDAQRQAFQPGRACARGAQDGVGGQGHRLLGRAGRRHIGQGHRHGLARAVEEAHIGIARALQAHQHLGGQHHALQRRIGRERDRNADGVGRRAVGIGRRLGHAGAQGQGGSGQHQGQVQGDRLVHSSVSGCDGAGGGAAGSAGAAALDGDFGGRGAK